MSPYEVAFMPPQEKSHRRVLEQIHTAWFSDARPPAQPRPVIRESWLRVRRGGLSPSGGSGAGIVGGHDGGSVAPRRPGMGILAVLPIVRSVLDPLIDDGVVLAVLADRDGTVRWRSGGRQVLRRADALGFRTGRDWSEEVVGTNAIGTALHTGRPVQVHAAEHFCVSHHSWSCAAAPVIDPRTARPLGAIDLSCAAEDANPMAVALVASVARQVGLELRAGHRRSLDRLRVSTRVPSAGPWALVDDWGWVAASAGAPPAERIRLPGCPEGLFMARSLGLVRGERVTGGWLLHPVREAAGPERREALELGVGAHLCRLTVRGPGLPSTHEIGGRRASILAWLVDHPGGGSARALSLSVYGRADAVAAVRAEICRINAELGTVVRSRPYRIDDAVRIVDRR